jgi:hypothetical protein
MLGEFVRVVLDFLQQYSGALMVMATLLLAGITYYYARLTKTIVSTASKQLRLSLNPVIGIRVHGVRISHVFGGDRRDMSVDLELTNAGNAPAVEVLIDAEIQLRHSAIKSHNTIPMRFEPEMIPFIKPGDTISGPSFISFGNTLIIHFFDDVREQERLNLLRIETDPTQEAYKASRLRILAYYRNSLEQYFQSYYEVDIGFWKPSKKVEDLIPANDKSAYVSLSNVPRPVFQEISDRNKIRELCGW